MKAKTTLLVVMLSVVAMSCSSGGMFAGRRLRTPRMATFPEPGFCLPYTSDNVIASIHRGGDFCATYVEYSGVRFDLDYACEAEIVLWISPVDTNFATPEGVHVGSSLAEARSAGGMLLKKRSEPWEAQSCEIVLPSGWVGEIPSCQPDSQARISRLEKSLSQEEIERILEESWQ